MLAEHHSQFLGMQHTLHLDSLAHAFATPIYIHYAHPRRGASRVRFHRLGSSSSWGWAPWLPQRVGAPRAGHRRWGRRAGEGRSISAAGLGSARCATATASHKTRARRWCILLRMISARLTVHCFTNLVTYNIRSLKYTLCTVCITFYRQIRKHGQHLQ